MSPPFNRVLLLNFPEEKKGKMNPGIRGVQGALRTIALKQETDEPGNRRVEFRNKWDISAIPAFIFIPASFLLFIFPVA